MGPAEQPLSHLGRVSGVSCVVAHALLLDWALLLQAPWWAGSPADWLCRLLLWQRSARGPAGALLRKDRRVEELVGWGSERPEASLQVCGVWSPRRAPVWAGLPGGSLSAPQDSCYCMGLAALPPGSLPRELLPGGQGARGTGWLRESGQGQRRERHRPSP